MNHNYSPPLFVARSLLAAFVLLVAFCSVAMSQTANVTVTGSDGNGGFEFRWLLEEDRNYQHDPANPNPDSLSTNFHKSYMPLVAKGEASGSASIENLDPGKTYFVSVLPKAPGTYTIGGAPIRAGQTDVKVVLNKLPLPTAQISIFVFEDNYPINNAPDLPEERGLQGFTIILEEAGGRFGASGGQVLQDAFGNPLGTTYDANGDVLQLGSGNIKTNADGVAVVKNLFPAKYGVRIAPPLGQDWIQTSTIEGSKVIDAWVKANEPPYFTEFGPAGHHADFGFVRLTNKISELPNPSGNTGSIRGQVVSTHMSRPPDYSFFPGTPFPDAYVGLNVPNGEGIYAALTGAESRFEITGLPPGTYDLVVWDKNLDIVFGSQLVTIPPAGGTVDLGTVGVFDWFSRIQGQVFFDTNENGFPDPGEPGIPDQAVNLRWRDGTLYSGNATDNMGYYSFSEVFPFFSWLVAEVDFARFKATGMTAVVDAGGQVPPDAGWAMPSDNRLNPQIQPETGLPYRTETGEVLTQAFQGFLGQTSMIYWGKSMYDPMDDLDNGGISGMVFYDTTRAEDDPRDNLGEEWQPGIPNVQLNLYRDDDGDGVVDDINGESTAVNFHDYTIEPYGTTLGQDVNAVATVEDAGKALRIVGNGWKKIAFAQPLSVTSGTVIEFDFMSSAEGEIHGIGFDTDDDQSENLTFQLYGTQSWSIQDVNDYQDGDGVKHYAIPVGRFFTGDMDFLTFVNDHDVPAPTGESYFANIVIYDSNDPNSGIQMADTDNYPFGWSDGGVKGPEDVDHNNNGDFDQGDAIQVTWTDSWDDSLPTDCPGDPADPFYMDGKCYDGLRNFNQVRDGVFDGGYAFTGIESSRTYIVEAVPPPVYSIVRSQDKNVDFGDDYTPGEQFLPPICVGPEYVVPDELTLFPGVAAPLAGETLNDCNMKQIFLAKGAKNSAAEFFMFTDVPPSGHVKGFILDDLANEFDVNNPNFGEKYAPPFLPVAFYDYDGNEITRVYSDKYGTYNALVPSTYTTNTPSPSGMSPNMLIACMNDPGPIPDGAGGMIPDPNYNPQYTQFCYTFQYMPGVTTYLDTPVLPIAAFAGPGQASLDCEYPHRTPVVNFVTDNANGHGGGPYTKPGRNIWINALGWSFVPNPAYTPDNGKPKLIKRDYTFSATQGRVFIGETELEVTQWKPNNIRAIIPEGTETGRLMVIRGDNGAESPLGVTVTVDPEDQETVLAVPSEYATIQAAIDAAPSGALVLVERGTYEELVVMYKPLRLQGWGANSVIINAVKRPGEKLDAWRDKVREIVNAGDADLLPGQVLDFDPANNEPGFLASAEGPAILVMGKNALPIFGGFGPDPRARIDGLTLTGADIGGGIVVNGYARYLDITNNRIRGNEGHDGGGIQIGHPFVEDFPTDAENDYITIRYNQITQNGSPIGNPGGVAIYTGTDGYEITDNLICGNYGTGSGGGIGHIGLSDGGLIADNHILFNYAFNQFPGDFGGGGIAVEGARQIGGGLTAGAGDVTIRDNLIQGNAAGAGDGGGLRLAYVNGMDVALDPDRVGRWHEIIAVNNMIVNNVSGLAGGGISLQDATRVMMLHNTVAHNDSTATASGAFQGDPNVSTPQPAGIVSRGHSPDLLAVIADGQPTYSRPRRLRSTIVWKNRSYYWDATAENGDGVAVGGLFANPAGLFQDLGVLGSAGSLNPRFCVLTDTAGYQNPNFHNISDDPLFVEGYFNGASGAAIVPEDSTPLTAAAADEGGNFIDLRFAPLTLTGDYHIQADSPAEDVGDTADLGRARLGLDRDFDHEERPEGDGPDIGADEIQE